MWQACDRETLFWTGLEHSLPGHVAKINYAPWISGYAGVIVRFVWNTQEVRARVLLNGRTSTMFAHLPGIVLNTSCVKLLAAAILYRVRDCDTLDSPRGNVFHAESPP